MGRSQAQPLNQDQATRTKPSIPMSRLARLRLPPTPTSLSSVSFLRKVSRYGYSEAALLTKAHILYLGTCQKGEKCTYSHDFPVEKVYSFEFICISIFKLPLV